MNRVEMLQAGWMAHRRVLLDLLDRIPEDQVNFTPWDGAMSLGALAVHAADDFFYHFVKTGEMVRSTSEWTTLADVKKIVKDRTDNINAIFASLTEADLDKVLEIPQMNMKFPGAVYLATAKDHEVHHKGQLFVYARMAGVKDMPFFVSRG